MNLATGLLTTLVTFNGTNGANPAAGLVADATGNLYGTAAQGGDQTQGPSGTGDGTVFKLNPNTDSFTTLATFAGGTNGSQPDGRLISNAGNLYGTTFYEGT